MPPARTSHTLSAAASQDQGGRGDPSGRPYHFFAIVPPFAVIVISTLLASFAWSTDPLASPATIPSRLPSTPTFPDSVTDFGQTDMPPTDLPETQVAETYIAPPPAAVLEAHIVPSTESPIDVRTDISTIPLLDSVADFLGLGGSPGISPVFTLEVLHWGTDITRWAAAAQLDPNLAATVMQIESCGDPRATSSAGAMGLFQVMPFHFYGTDSPYNPNTNAARGLAYLARSLQASNGDSRLALAGYNGGIGVIDRSEWTWSAQTKRYVQYGWPIYQDARRGVSTSNAVDEWYSRYGASLCRQAHERLGLQ